MIRIIVLTILTALYAWVTRDWPWPLTLFVFLLIVAGVVITFSVLPAVWNS